MAFETRPCTSITVSTWAMSETMTIFLVGPMGVGKTTIGKQLAAVLHMAFFDSDQEIEHRTSADIALIFDLEGEAGFRKRESAMIEDLTCRENIVLATGGGVVLDEKNRARLASRGRVIYLKAGIEQLLQRTLRDRGRPLLQKTDDKRGKLEELMKVRDPLYREVADLVVDTDGRKLFNVVKDIQTKLANWNRQ